MQDDLCLAIAFPSDDDAKALLDELHELEVEGRGTFDERLIVSRDGARVYVYGDTEERLGSARDLLHEAMQARGLGGMMRMSRWHPIEERWEPAELPLPRTDEEREAERLVRLARETEESLESGYAEWEVRIELPSHRETVELARRLEAAGVPVVRRWTYLLIGAANEDEAADLAHRLEVEAPEARVSVEPGGQMVYEVLPKNPFVVFGGLGL